MILLGLAAVLLGILISFWISLGLILLYFLGLVIIQRVTSKKSVYLEKTVFFNTALALSNMNFSVLEPKFKIKARLGHLAQWVEFHAKPQRPKSAAV
jgi:hypothetical protein